MTALPELPGPPGVPADAPRLVVRGPDCLPAVVPHLLGFHPDDSVVVLGLEPGTSQVRVTLRIDLPPEDDDGSGWAALVPAFHRAGALEALLVVYPPAGADPWREGEPLPLPHRAVVDTAADLLAAGGVRALDAVCVVDDRMRSYWCLDQVCCPPEGRAVPASEQLRIDAEFVAAGSAPLGSRRSLELQLEPRPDDDAFREEVDDRVMELRPDVASYGVAEVESFLLGLSILGAGTDQPNLLATLVAQASSLCEWVRPRDLLMRALSVDADPAILRAARTVLVEAVRCAPFTEAAPVASLLAVCAWISGDGASARVALDRAAAADPTYSLATLLTAALDSGLPPWSWASMMADLTVDRILTTGDGRPRSVPPEDVLAGLGAPGWEPDDADGLDALDDLVDLLDDDETWDGCTDPRCAACACARGTEGGPGQAV